MDGGYKFQVEILIQTTYHMTKIGRETTQRLNARHAKKYLSLVIHACMLALMAKKGFADVQHAEIQPGMWLSAGNQVALNG